MDLGELMARIIGFAFVGAFVFGGLECLVSLLRSLWSDKR